MLHEAITTSDTTLIEKVPSEVDVFSTTSAGCCSIMSKISQPFWRLWRGERLVFNVIRYALRSHTADNLHVEVNTAERRKARFLHIDYEGLELDDGSV